MTDNGCGRKAGNQGEPQEHKSVNPTEDQGTGYIGADTHLPPYLPYPRFLLKMEITQTAKFLYALLLDRATLSQRNGWLDESGRTYIIFPVAAIADALDRSLSTVKEALNELDRAGLLERKRQGFSAANHQYVKLPPVAQISVPMESENPYLISPENWTTDSQKTGLMKSGKLASNNYNINKTIESQTKRVNGGRTAHGRYCNIVLSKEDFSELEKEYPGRLQRFIEEMSRYLAATGKSYHNYAAAIRIWADNDRKDNAAQGIPDYEYKEGESL